MQRFNHASFIHNARIQHNVWILDYPRISLGDAGFRVDRARKVFEQAAAQAAEKARAREAKLAAV